MGKQEYLERLNEGTHLKNKGIAYVSLLLDQMMKNIRASNLSGAVFSSMFK